MAVNEVSIQKYLDGIVAINSTLGRLDVLRLHIKAMYDDKMANAIIESIIKDLSNVCGVNYKTIELDIPTIKPLTNETKQIIEEKNANMGYVKKDEPIKIEIIEDNNVQYENKTKANNIPAGLKKLIQPLEKKQETQKLGVEFDEVSNKYTYSFNSSNTLGYSIYNDNDRSMIINFIKNGRTYKYNNVPRYIFDNLVNLDERGASAGAYLQQNIVKKWKNGQYKEITNDEFIG